MAEKVHVKALVDKGSNKIIFIEADSDFIDVLFSFLTIPLGRIVSLTCSHTVPAEVPTEVGCMKNLYQSIEQIGVHEFRSVACKDMLLLPDNAAKFHCTNLKLKLDNAESTCIWQCYSCKKSCVTEKVKKHFAYSICPCCRNSYYWDQFSVNDSQVGGVFVKGRPRLLITDDLQVIPPVGAASISLFSKLGVSSTKATEELTIGVEEVSNLLMNSLLSKTPLTEALLKHKPILNLGDVNSNQGIFLDSLMSGNTTNEEEKTIAVRLIVSKSKKMVCYAEAREDFVNLLCSFLALPLGFILEKMQNCSWEGCIDQLYKSIQGLDELYLKSNYHKELLVKPKLAPCFLHENLPLGIQEASFYKVDGKITTDESKISANSVKLEVVDPKSQEDKDNSAHGFFKGPALFTVTDNLIVRLISSIFAMSVLEELKVPVTDIEDQIVHVGEKEALRLLVASFVGGNALTNAFLKNLKEPKQEQ